MSAEVQATCRAMLERVAWFELEHAEQGYDDVLRRQLARAVLWLSLFPALGGFSAGAATLIGYPFYSALEGLGLLGAPWSRVVVVGGLGAAAAATFYARYLRRLWTLDLLPVGVGAVRREAQVCLAAALSRCAPHAAPEATAAWGWTRLDSDGWGWRLEWTHRAGARLDLRGWGAAHERGLSCASSAHSATFERVWTYDAPARVWRDGLGQTTAEVTGAAADALGRWVEALGSSGAVALLAAERAPAPALPSEGLVLTLSAPTVAVTLPDPALGARARWRHAIARTIELLCLGGWALATVAASYYYTNAHNHGAHFVHSAHRVGFAALACLGTLVWGHAGVLPYTRGIYTPRDRALPIPPPPEPPAAVTLERAGDVLQLQGVSIDLAQPFQAHLTRDPEAPRLGITLAQNTARLQLCTEAALSDDFYLLPKLALDGAWITPKQLTARLWPELAAYGALHGLRLPRLTRAGGAEG